MRLRFCRKFKISHLGREFTKDPTSQATPVVNLIFQIKGKKLSKMSRDSLNWPPCEKCLWRTPAVSEVFSINWMFTLRSTDELVNRMTGYNCVVVFQMASLRSVTYDPRRQIDGKGLILTPWDMNYDPSIIDKATGAQRRAIAFLQHTVIWWQSWDSLGWSKCGSWKGNWIVLGVMEAGWLSRELQDDVVSGVPSGWNSLTSC